MNAPFASAVDNLPVHERTLLRALSSSADFEVRAELVVAIDRHVTLTADALGKNELLDVGLARRIAGALRCLLDGYEDLATAHARALAIGAARFFVERQDAEPDLGSALGFDDDARVLNAVLDDVGRADLKVEL